MQFVDLVHKRLLEMVAYLHEIEEKDGAEAPVYSFNCAKAGSFPMQDDGSSCGLFAIKYVHALIEGQLTAASFPTSKR